MNGLDLGEIHDAVLGAEAGELPDRLAVGAPGIGIADVRAEEVAHPRPRLRPHGEDRGQGREWCDDQSRVHVGPISLRPQWVGKKR